MRGEVRQNLSDVKAEVRQNMSDAKSDTKAVVDNMRMMLRHLSTM